MNIIYKDKEGNFKNIDNIGILKHFEEHDYCPLRYIESIQEITYIDGFLCTLEELNELVDTKYSLLNIELWYDVDFIALFGRKKISKMFLTLFYLQEIKYYNTSRWTVYACFRKEGYSLYDSLKYAFSDFGVCLGWDGFGEEVNNSRSDNYVENATKEQLIEIGKDWFYNHKDEDSFINIKKGDWIYSFEK